MKKVFYAFILAPIFMVACNKATNDSSVAAPPAPTNQCVQSTAVAGNGANGVYNPYNPNAYNPYNPYSTGTTVAANGCNAAVYNQYTSAGFSAYPYTSFNSYNWSAGGYSYTPLCDCPANTRPVYNGTIGMGCVSNVQFQPISVGAYYYSLQATNNQWVNWVQVSNMTSTIGNMANCYQQVSLSCFTDVPNSCGATGSVCQPTISGSRLGICRAP